MEMHDKKLGFPKFEDVSTEQLVEAQAHIWNHMFSFINSVSLNCAIQLGIPDIIHRHGKPMTLSQLVNSLRINEAKTPLIYRLMRILTYSKFFMRFNNPGAKSDGEEGKKEEGFYWLTPASHLLVKDGPVTLAPIVQLAMDPIMIKPFGFMSESIVSGNNVSSFEMEHGTTLWELSGQELRLNDLFNRSMSSGMRLCMQVLLNEYRQVFEGIELLVDVGGGIGTTAKEMLGVFPGMKCIVLDLPHVVAGLEDSGNLMYVGGDMFESIPPGDAILLKCILHDWNDESSIRILKKCREAVSNNNKGMVVGGKVIIVDMVLDDFCQGNDNDETQAKLFCDIAMMNYVNGKERSEKEWAKLFMDTGFSTYKIYPSLGMRSLVELYL